jgi:hypothetical protein
MLVTVLLGSSSYDADSRPKGSEDSTEEWLLGDDVRGRGVRVASGRTTRSITAEELVRAIMSAEKVIQFP